jgi:hypothetical protein
MKLIKINTDHYVVVDDSEIKEGDWYYSYLSETIGQAAPNAIGNPNLKKITHSTRPFGGSATAISLYEVKELIGEVYVEKKAEEYFNAYDNTEHTEGLITGFEHGYNQALEDNKEKKYTEKDVIKAILYGMKKGLDVGKIDETDNDWVRNYVKSLQPKTEWEVEMVDGKLKLK